MKKHRWVGCVLCVAGMGLAQAFGAGMTPVFDWNFTAAEGWAGNSWQEVAAAGFSVAFERLEQVSDESRNARVYVDTQAGYERLRLRIPAQEEGLGRGQPVLTYAFPASVQPALQGKLSFEAGLTGTDSQAAVVELRSGHSVLLSIHLRTGSPRVFKHSGTGDEEEESSFDAPAASVYAPMATRWQRYVLTWKVSPDGSGSSATLWVERGDGGKAPLTLSDASFRMAGVPDNIRLSVGWSTYGSGAQDREKGVYVNTLKLEVSGE